MGRWARGDLCRWGACCCPVVGRRLGSHEEQAEVRLEGGLACVEEDLKPREDREDQEDEEGTVQEAGGPAEGEGGLVGDRNLEEGGPEARVPMEAAQTDQGRALEEGVCPREESPEEGGGLGLEEGGQEGPVEQGGLVGVAGGLAYQQSVVAVLQDQGDQGIGLGQGVRGTCPCLDFPWGTRETLQGAQLSPPQTSVPTGCLSFYATASQTGSGTVCYRASLSDSDRGAPSSRAGPSTFLRSPRRRH